MATVSTDSKIRLDILVAAVLLNKADIKGCVVSHQHTVPDKLQKLRQHFLDGRGVHDHGVGNAGELGDLKRNRASAGSQKC